MQVYEHAHADHGGILLQTAADATAYGSRPSTRVVHYMDFPDPDADLRPVLAALIHAYDATSPFAREWTLRASVAPVFETVIQTMWSLHTRPLMVVLPWATLRALEPRIASWSNTTWRAMASICACDESHNRSWVALLEDAARCDTASLERVAATGRTALSRDPDGPASWELLRKEIQSGAVELVETRVCVQDMGELMLWRARGTRVASLIRSIACRLWRLPGHVRPSRDTCTLAACGETLDPKRTLEEYGVDEDTPLFFTPFFTP